MADLTPRDSYRPLLWPDVIHDLESLAAAHSQPIYVVGGAVRDALLNRPITDIDLAVAEGGIALARRITNALHGDFFPLDAERDVGRVLAPTAEGRLIIDVARFRGDDLLADLSDRDFTINAMAVDLAGDTGRLIDPLDGEQDVRNRIVRRCSPTSLTDDPIRALRAVRQSIQLGMRIEQETLRDVRLAGAQLAGVSAERLRDELIKLLASSKARSALRVAEALGLFREILPEIAILRSRPARSADYADGWQETLAVVEKTSHLLIAISPQRTEHTGASFGVGMLIMQLDRYRRALQQHVGHLWPNDRPHSALLTLAALLHGVEPEVAASRAQALRLSNAERDWLTTTVRDYRLPLDMPTLSPLEVHRFWRRTGEAGVDVCMLAAAYDLGVAASELNQDHWLDVVERIRVLLDAYYDHYSELVDPPALLDGNQLMAQLGLERGPIIGTLLEVIREGQVTGQVCSADDALALARRALDEYHK